MNNPREIHRPCNGSPANRRAPSGSARSACWAACGHPARFNQRLLCMVLLMIMVWLIASLVAVSSQTRADGSCALDPSSSREPQACGRRLFTATPSPETGVQGKGQHKHQQCARLVLAAFSLSSVCGGFGREGVRAEGRRLRAIRTIHARAIRGESGGGDGRGAARAGKERGAVAVLMGWRSWVGGGAIESSSPNPGIRSR